MFEENLLPITPVNFFQLAFDCRSLAAVGPFPAINGRNKDKFALPDTSGLCGDEHFATVACGWRQEGLEFYFKVDTPFEQSYFPGVERGDSVEVLIDTRDVKSSGYNTRFCHHFFFLPEPVEGRQAGEITHFRTEDRHELCAPSQLQVIAKVDKKSYVIQSWIPKECLVGYDPEQFPRLGMTYRINRPRWQSQHLSVVSEDYQLEQQPSLWSSVRLVP